MTSPSTTPNPADDPAGAGGAPGPTGAAGPTQAGPVPAPRPRRGIRRWIADLALGVRLSVGGGRSGWLRLTLIGIGIGIGVTMFLSAASIPSVLQARDDRDAARAVVRTEALPPGPDTLLANEVRSAWRDQEIVGQLLQPEGEDAPLPPGVDQRLGPGELVVSPALARLMASDHGGVLRNRWGEEVVGTIAPAGLAGPEELTFYLGTDQLTERSAARIDRFGGPIDDGAGPDVAFMMLGLVGMVAMLLPVAIFIATAVRFGSEARDRRLAALRLVGADATSTRRIAAGESLTGAALGLVLGTAAYLVLGRVVGSLVPAQLSFFPADFRPVPTLAILVVLLVPVTAVLVTMSALKRVMIEPLGVSRRAYRPSRHVWWRLVLPAGGIALLQPLYGGLDQDEASTIAQLMVAAGLVFLLLGIAVLLPWLVEAVVRRLGRGGVAWELAVRRLQLDSGTSVRAVSGIAVSVAGLIALHGLVGAIEQTTVRNHPGTGTFQADILDVGHSEHTDQDWKRALAETPGVETVDTLTTIAATPKSDDDGEPMIRIGSCAVLAMEASLSSCSNGDVFVVAGPDTAPLPENSSYLLGTGSTSDPASGPGSDSGSDPANENAEELATRWSTWTLPDSARTVEPARGSVAAMGVSVTPTILLTPAALSGLSYEPRTIETYIGLDAAYPDALDQVRNTAAELDPLAYVGTVEQTSMLTAMRTIRQGLLVGTVALLLMIGASMLVNVIEQIRERRRPLAVLLAFGTRRRTLGGSVLYQVAIPMFLGLLLAAVTGTGLALMLRTAIDAPLGFDWIGVSATSGIAALVVLLTTVATLPLLWRLTHPHELRSE